jgi:hypothetical protein
MDPLSMLAVFGPLVVELGKAAIGRWVQGGEYKPVNVSEFLQVRDSDMRLYSAMNSAGGSNASYPWVEAVIRLQRPFVAAVALSVWAGQELTLPGGATPSVANFAGAVGFYLFADRTLFHLRTPTKKS